MHGVYSVSNQIAQDLTNLTLEATNGTSAAAMHLNQDVRIEKPPLVISSSPSMLFEWYLLLQTCS
jgi:hypothetical protein